MILILAVTTILSASSNCGSSSSAILAIRLLLRSIAPGSTHHGRITWISTNEGDNLTYTQYLALMLADISTVQLQSSPMLAVGSFFLGATPARLSRYFVSWLPFMVLGLTRLCVLNYAPRTTRRGLKRTDIAKKTENHLCYPPIIGG